MLKSLIFVMLFGCSESRINELPVQYPKHEEVAPVIVEETQPLQDKQEISDTAQIVNIIGTCDHDEDIKKGAMLALADIASDDMKLVFDKGSDVSFGHPDNENTIDLSSISTKGIRLFSQECWARTIINAAVGKGNILVLVPDNAHGKLVQDIASSILQDKAHVHTYRSFSDINSVNSKGYDGLIVAESGDKLKYIVQKFGIHEKTWVAWPWIEKTALPDGVCIAVLDNDKEYRAFSEAYNRKWDIFPSIYSALAYDAVLLIRSKADIFKRALFKGVLGKFKVNLDGSVDRPLKIGLKSKVGFEILED